MKRILSSEFYQLFRSKAFYIFLAAMVLFYFWTITMSSFYSRPFATAEQQWNAMEDMEQSMYRTVMGANDWTDEELYTYIRNTHFSNAFGAEMAILFCLPFFIYFFGRESSSRRNNYPIYQGHSRARIMLSKFMIYDIVVTCFFLLMTILGQFWTNMGWTQLPIGYILRCFGLTELAILQIGGIYLLIYACFRSSILASIVSAVLYVILFIIQSLYLDAPLDAFRVIFPFLQHISAGSTSIWDLTLTPEQVRECILCAAWSVVLLVICHVGSVLVFKKRELQ